jgi:hypothetical protein
MAAACSFTLGSLVVIAYLQCLLKVAFHTFPESVLPSPSPNAILSLIALAPFELASMVCRNMCMRISSKIIVGQSHYSDGKKYCRRCEHYFITDKVFCECCGMQLRTTPMIGAYKRILRERLGTVGKKAAGRNNTPGSGS